MKKILLIGGAVACAMTLQATAAIPASRKLMQEKRVEAARKGPRHAAASEKWLPGTLTISYWDYEQQAWVENEVRRMTYFDNGLVSSEESPYQKTTYTYNDRGLKTSEIYSFMDGDAYVNSSKTEYVYDSVIDVETEYASYFWNVNEWSLNSLDKNVIIRDSAGNITKVEQYSSYDGEMELNETSEIKYGADGKATEIINTDVEDNEIELHLKDIVWENTDGQIFVTDYNDIDADDYFEGANRIKSATAVVYDDFDAPVYITAEYPDNKGSYKVKFTYNGKVIYTYDYTVLDVYGSYESEEFEIDYDYDEENNTLTEGGEYRYNESATYDAYGIMTSYKSSSVSDDYTYSHEEKTLVTYDSTYGYPTEAIMQLMSDGEFVNNSRTVYGDYQQFNSVADIVSEDAPVQYFNLQGMPVDSDNLSTGIYIRRKGGKTAKILVR